MFFKKNNEIDIKVNQGDYAFRFCNFIDQFARDFEEKIRQISPVKYSIVDDAGIEREIPWPNISFWQSYHYLEHRSDPYFLMQMLNRRTESYYQIAIHVEVSKISFFKTGTVHKWIMRTSPESIDDQNVLIEQLIKFCRLHTDLMNLRIQSYMPGDGSLEETRKVLLDLRFKDISPQSYIKTRMIDLGPSVEDMLSSFSANGRARLKIKQKDIEEIEIKKICDKADIPHLQNALNDSYQRSVSKNCPYNFGPLFSSREKFEKEVILLGFFLKKTLSAPMAFITGIKHHSIIEFSVGGSLSDSRLRQFPFNHLLMWNLALESKKNGGGFLDMGGISAGTDDDALSGITNFKRFFPGFELSIGKEMNQVLRPVHLSFYTKIQKIISRIRRGE